jgi:hypothetical protein
MPAAAGYLNARATIPDVKHDRDGIQLALAHAQASKKEGYVNTDGGGSNVDVRETSYLFADSLKK